MKTVSVIKNIDGLYLMNTMGPVDWTDKWEDAFLYADRKRAKSDRDFLGLSTADVETYDIIPPIPSEKKEKTKKEILKIKEDNEETKVYIITEKQEQEKEKKSIRCFKVGFSKNPINRVKQLQTGHPYKIGLEGWFDFPGEEEARLFEKELHLYFKDKHMAGEWFKFDDKVQHFIQDAHYNCSNFKRVIT